MIVREKIRLDVRPHVQPVQVKPQIPRIRGRGKIYTGGLLPRGSKMLTPRKSSPKTRTKFRRWNMKIIAAVLAAIGIYVVLGIYFPISGQTALVVTALGAAATARPASPSPGTPRTAARRSQPPRSSAPS